jgi:hypothetical protein
MFCCFFLVFQTEPDLSGHPLSGILCSPPSGGGDLGVCPAAAGAECTLGGLRRVWGKCFDFMWARTLCLGPGPEA